MIGDGVVRRLVTGGGGEIVSGGGRGGGVGRGATGRRIGVH